MKGHKKPSVRGEEERNRIVEANRALAWRFASARWGDPKVRRLGWDEAIAACYEGLLRAAELWEPELGKFSTLAWWHMRTALQRAVADNGLIHVPHRHQYAVRRPSKNELDYRAAAARAGNITFECDLGCDQGGLSGFIEDRADPDTPDPAAVVAALLDGPAGQALKPRQLQALRLRYQRGLTLDRVGDRMRVSKERARQLIDQGTQALRRQAEAGALAAG